MMPIHEPVPCARVHRRARTGGEHGHAIVKHGCVHTERRRVIVKRTDQYVDKLKRHLGRVGFVLELVHGKCEAAADAALDRVVQFDGTCI
jgi:hypothetical protein